MTGKTVLITGASSGIGYATALAFAEQGANLIVTARRQSRLEALADKLTTDFAVKVLPVVLDVRDRQACEQIISSLSEEWSTIDVLVNNAGMANQLIL